MKVYIVSELVGVGSLRFKKNLGVFTTLPLCKEKLIRIAKSKGISEKDIDKYIEENYSIDKWFVDTYCLRGE